MRANSAKICRIVAILARTDILSHDCYFTAQNYGNVSY